MVNRLDSLSALSLRSGRRVAQWIDTPNNTNAQQYYPEPDDHFLARFERALGDPAGAALLRIAFSASPEEIDTFADMLEALHLPFILTPPIRVASDLEIENIGSIGRREATNKQRLQRFFATPAARRISDLPPDAGWFPRGDAVVFQLHTVSIPWLPSPTGSTWPRERAWIGRVLFFARVWGRYPWPGPSGPLRESWAEVVGDSILPFLMAHADLVETDVKTFITVTFYANISEIQAKVAAIFEAKAQAAQIESILKTVGVGLFGVALGAALGGVALAVSKGVLTAVSDAHAQAAAEDLIDFANSLSGDFPDFAAETRRAAMEIHAKAAAARAASAPRSDGSPGAPSSRTVAGSDLAGAPTSLLDRIVLFLKRLFGGFLHAG